MKSYRINQEEMLSHDNIEQAFLKPSRGKRDRDDVKRTLENIEEEIVKVRNMIENNAFSPRKHTPVKINEQGHQKERTIIKPDYCYEQVVHHIVVNAIKDGIENGMYDYVLGSIPGRGAHLGKKVIERWIKNDPENTKYVLKMDIRHFFESVDHDILKAWLSKKFRGRYVLELLFLIIDVVEHGLPLGYYTSQWFANFLLQPLDHYIKEKLHVKYNTRYMDDIVCFGRNKKELHKVRIAINEYLNTELHLTMKGNWQVFRLEYEVQEYAITCNSLRELESLGNDFIKHKIKHKSKIHCGKRKIFVKSATSKAKANVYQALLKEYHANAEAVTVLHGRPLDYMGFEFHRNRTIMRESIMLRLTHKAIQVSKQEKINPKDASSLLASMGWVKHTDTYGMYEKRIKPLVKIKTLKKVVSKNQRRLNHENRMEKGNGFSGEKAGGNRQGIEQQVCVSAAEH